MMSLSLIVVSLGAVAAAVGTGALTARCARDPRIYLVAWAMGLFGLAISLGAQTLGYLAGYSGAMFRAMELGAQVLAPLALCLGIAELVGRAVPARFAMRLAVSAITVITAVILGTDPLNPVAKFSKRWPDPSVFYEVVPKALLEFLLGPFTALVAVIAVLVTLWRLRREQSAQDVVLPIVTTAAAALLLALPGLSLLLQRAGMALPASHRIFGPACVLAAGLTWLAGVRAERAGLGERHAAERRTDGWDDADGYGADGWHDQAAGLDDPYEAAEFGGYSAGAGHAGGRRYQPADAGAGYGGAGRGDEPEYAGNGRAAAAAGQRFGSHLADGPNPALAALVAEVGGGPAPLPDEAIHGPAGGYGDPDIPGGRGGRRPSVSDDPHAHLFGQIAIYTLIEERVEDFDRLTERVVAQVRAREPDTLVYIVHAVPTVPMQRILYEVYRDRAAYDEHLQRPYVARYEAERRPFVLAANVIELGLQQVKISPLPSISDILTESGIDLTGVTRSPRGVAPPPGGGYPAAQPPVRPAERLSAAAPPVPVPPAPVPPASRQSGEPGYDPRYRGWAELRGEDPPHR